MDKKNKIKLAAWMIWQSSNVERLKLEGRKTIIKNNKKIAKILE